MTDGTSLRIQGEPPVIQEIAALVQDSEAAEVLRIETDDEGGIGADFDLETVSTIIGIASNLFFAGPMIPALLGIFRRHKGTKVTIETPTRSVSIESNKELSLDQLQEMLGALARA
jgi:hypothetical protein